MRALGILLLLAACDQNAMVPVDHGQPQNTTLNDANASAACASYVEATCGRMEACEPMRMKEKFCDSATCQSRMKLVCMNNLKDSGTTLTSDRLAACASQLQLQSCDDRFDHVVPDECVALPGSLGDGSPCGDDGQCQSAHCRKQGDVCGRCFPRERSCNEDDDCERGWMCNSGDCAQRVPAGAACDYQRPCAYGFTCDGGVCKSPRARGMSCTLSTGGDNCDQLHGDWCDLDLRVCGAVPFAALGESCGYPGGTPIYCTADASCQADRCVALPADGNPCDPDIGCLYPANCLEGRCVIPDTSSCR
jgi:hypothetical protein